jgi:tetratricopeptide (TPR) repeat protein
LSLGILEHYYGWNLAREERLFRLALARDPVSAEVYFWLAICLALAGRVDEAVQFAREGARLEPHSANNRAALGWPLFISHRHEEAAAEFKAAVALGDAPFAVWSNGMALSTLGRHDEAIAAHRKAIDLTGGRYSYYTALLADALAQGGRIDEARVLVRDLDERATREYVPWFDRAIAQASLGSDDAVLTALERACQDRNALMWSRIHSFPQLQRLRETPRFRALAEQLAMRAPVKQL